MHESSVQLTKAKKAIAFSICSLDFQRRLRKQVMWREPKKSHGVCPPIWKTIQSSEPTEGTGREWPLWGLSEIPTSDLSHYPPQAGGCVGQDRGFALRDCGRAHDRPACPCHRVQLQLLLPPGNRPGGDAESELQPCPELSLPARGLRSAQNINNQASS